jgi:hypothetical protein
MLYRLLMIVFLVSSTFFGCAYKCDVSWDSDASYVDTWTGVSTDESDAQNDCEDFWGYGYSCDSCELDL